MSSIKIRWTANIWVSWSFPSCWTLNVFSRIIWVTRMLLTLFLLTFTGQHLIGRWQLYWQTCTENCMFSDWLLLDVLGKRRMAFKSTFTGKQSRICFPEIPGRMFLECLTVFLVCLWADVLRLKNRAIKRFTFIQAGKTISVFSEMPHYPETFSCRSRQHGETVSTAQTHTLLRERLLICLSISLFSVSAPYPFIPYRLISLFSVSAPYPFIHYRLISLFSVSAPYPFIHYRLISLFSVSAPYPFIHYRLISLFSVSAPYPFIHYRLISPSSPSQLRIRSFITD